MSIHTLSSPTPSPQEPGETHHELLNPWPKWSWKGIALLVFLFALYVWGAVGSELKPIEFIKGFPDFVRLLMRFFPPAFEWETISFMTPAISMPGITIPSIGFPVSFPYPIIINSILQTVQMALIGTTLGIILSIPFAFLAARNTTPHVWIYNTTRIIMNANRAIPDLIFAMLFVSAVGMGPFGGVLALAIGSVGSIGKVFAEAIESIDPHQVFAIRATGANAVNTFLYGVVPQALPMMASYSLLYFEHNVRSATILGMVGAGGVGFELDLFFRSFQYNKLLGAILLILITVTIIDRISDSLRKRMV